LGLVEHGEHFGVGVLAGLFHYGHHALAIHTATLSGSHHALAHSFLGRLLDFSELGGLSFAHADFLGNLRSLEGVDAFLLQPKLIEALPLSFVENGLELLLLLGLLCLHLRGVEAASRAACTCASGRAALTAAARTACTSATGRTTLTTTARTGCATGGTASRPACSTIREELGNLCFLSVGDGQFFLDVGTHD
jgi:hypothetical protein